MSKKIKSVLHLSLTSALSIVIVGCSGKPAPWTQVNDSPWEAKYEEKTTSETTTESEDPVLLADTTEDNKPDVIQEPEIAPETKVMVPVVVEEEPVNQGIMSMLSSNYAVQVYAGNTIASIEKYKKKYGLEHLTTVKTERSGSVVYVLVDIYPNRTLANSAATDLERTTGTKPWVRSLAGLQKIAVQ